jgi:hypothetical protein
MGSMGIKAGSRCKDREVKEDVCHSAKDGRPRGMRVRARGKNAFNLKGV